MIVTFTLNPAWDVTYAVSDLLPGDSHRVTEVIGQAGGKGVNVSRVLRQMGYATVVTGLIGGAIGAAVDDELARVGLATNFFRIPAESRRTVTVVNDAGTATVLNEPGPTIEPTAWPEFLTRARVLLGRAKVAVLAGSLPPGVPEDAYRQLVELAHEYDCMCVVDADGDALVAALSAGPDVIKPNRAELMRATRASTLVDGAYAARAAGARHVVVSDGPCGLFSLSEVGAFHARPPSVTPRNPTGAGDAAVAALAVGLCRGDASQELLRRAAAWSAAATLELSAGLLDTSRIRELSEQTHIRQPHGGEAWEIAC